MAAASRGRARLPDLGLRLEDVIQMLLPGRYLRPRRNLQVPDQLRVVRLQVRPQAYHGQVPDLLPGRRYLASQCVQVVHSGYPPEGELRPPCRVPENALSVPVRSVLSYMI